MQIVVAVASLEEVMIQCPKFPDNLFREDGMKNIRQGDWVSGGDSPSVAELLSMLGQNPGEEQICRILQELIERTPINSEEYRNTCRQNILSLIDARYIPLSSLNYACRLLMECGAQGEALDLLLNDQVAPSDWMDLAARLCSLGDDYALRLIRNMFSRISQVKSVKNATEFTKLLNINWIIKILVDLDYKEQDINNDLSGDIFLFGLCGHPESPLRLLDLDDGYVVLTCEEFQNMVAKWRPMKLGEAIASVLPADRPAVPCRRAADRKQRRIWRALAGIGMSTLAEANRLKNGAVRPLRSTQRPEGDDDGQH